MAMMSCCGKCTTRVTWCYMQELTFILQVWPKASLKNWPTSVFFFFSLTPFCRDRSQVNTHVHFQDPNFDNKYF